MWLSPATVASGSEKYGGLLPNRNNQVTGVASTTLAWPGSMPSRSYRACIAIIGLRLPLVELTVALDQSAVTKGSPARGLDGWSGECPRQDSNLRHPL
jgi:hypothetical protein